MTTYSFRNQLFYILKPLIPRPVQIFIRRQIARYKLKKYAHIWPIDPSSAKPPKGWPGWPDGKRFALVLSHDVDTKIGQDRVLDLAALELQLEFRSAFNFVPERYTNHKDVKDYLKTNGFEINVHGLRHDGREFGSRSIFEKRRVKINKMLRDWGTSGFTAPSMLSNPVWLHDLDITHSISTFDTDPFEPHSDPAGTIFPYWVANGHSKKGYVELPYTLPQDHLLFVILRESNIDTWKRKLDWIAAHGGMALLNTHSDYMHFGDRPVNGEEYPVQFYRSFLNHVKTQYQGEFYHGLPGDVARLFVP